MLCRNIAIINKGTIVENTSMKALLSKLSLETFVLDIKIPDGMTTTDDLLTGFEHRLIDDHTLEVDMSMRNKSNRLEELFVRLVESAKQAG